MSTFSTNLKKLRLDKKLTQEQVATQLQVSPQAVSRGDSLRAMQRYNEAFAAWQRAYELDLHWQDALFSTAFCCEELGQYSKAAGVWAQIVCALLERSLEEASKRPQEMAEKCHKKAMAE